MTNRYDNRLSWLIHLALLLLLSAGRAFAADAAWTKGMIKGHFLPKQDSFPSMQPFARGVGATSFSFASGKTVSSGGDLLLLLRIRSASDIDFALNCDGLVDLGAFPAAMKESSFPAKVPRIDGPYDDTVEPVVGHVYLGRKGTSWFVVRLTDFTISATTPAPDQRFVKLEVDAELAFEYLPPTESFDAMKQRFLQMIAQPTAKSEQGDPAQNVAPATAPATSNIPAPRVPPSTEAGPLAAAYEQFQSDAKAFLDLPTEQATVPKCDTLLETAKNLTTRMNDQIGEVDSTITGNGAKVSSLNERLAKITDLQLKDRTQTRISKIKEETERLQKDLKEWTAKLDELQKTEKKLREYRLIIGI